MANAEYQSSICSPNDTTCEDVGIGGLKPVAHAAAVVANWYVYLSSSIIIVIVIIN